MSEWTRERIEVIADRVATTGDHEAATLIRDLLEVGIEAQQEAIDAEAALEAAREDGVEVIRRIEQYADDQERDPIVVPSARLRGWAADLRQAIDQARGKGVQGEA